MNNQSLQVLLMQKCNLILIIISKYFLKFENKQVSSLNVSKTIIHAEMTMF